MKNYKQIEVTEEVKTVYYEWACVSCLTISRSKYTPENPNYCANCLKIMRQEERKTEKEKYQKEVEDSGVIGATITEIITEGVSDIVGINIRLATGGNAVIYLEQPDCSDDEATMFIYKGTFNDVDLRGRCELIIQ